jgi:phenylacetate-CoA ligase
MLVESMSSELFETWASLAELWWTRSGGLPMIEPRRRLETLVRYAREHSPFYREHYAHLPPQGLVLGDLPPVARPQLMERFDDWATDRRLRLREVREFLSDRSRVGQRFLERYWVWKSSGTSGFPGIFVQDAQALAVYDALVTAQLGNAPWRAGAPLRAFAGGMRAALVVATGDHFASITSWERTRRANPALDSRAFSVLDPLARLVEQLNAFRPGVIAGYPSALALLAEERARGRLRIAPVVAWSGGEHLAPAARAAIETAFDCPVMNEYGASECLSIAHECEQGWMHLHHEWVVVEGVDRDGSPTPPGDISHDTLITNLANWAQPVIRYAIGDRTMVAPRPCACGNPLPAFRVEGRMEETLALRPARGAPVRLLPLALSTVIEEVAGTHRFQIAQLGPQRLALRIATAEGGPAAGRVRAKAAAAVKALLRSQSLTNVELVQDPAPPRLDQPSGKLRCVVIEDRTSA